MNFKTFIFMILTFRRVDPIPRNIGLMLSTTFWISIVWIISNFTIFGRCHPFPCGEGRGPPARGDRPSIL